MSKLWDDPSRAVKDYLFDGVTIMVGGFGLCGIPEALIEVVKESGVKNLTIISNNCGVDHFGLGKLLDTKQIKKMISSYVGENKVFESQYLEGVIEVEFNPQGTLAERIRAGGAGIPAFFTPTGVGTLIAEGKEVREFEGKSYVLETALHADLSLIKAFQADPLGNLTYRMSAQNFNPLMAAAGKHCIAEVDMVLREGELDPNTIHTPGIYISRVICNPNAEKRIERKTVKHEKGDS